MPPSDPLVLRSTPSSGSARNIYGQCFLPRHLFLNVREGPYTNIGVEYLPRHKVVQALLSLHPRGHSSLLLYPCPFSKVHEADHQFPLVVSTLWVRRYNEFTPGHGTARCDTYTIAQRLSRGFTRVPWSFLHFLAPFSGGHQCRKARDEVHRGNISGQELEIFMSRSFPVVRRATRQKPGPWSTTPGSHPREMGVSWRRREFSHSRNNTAEEFLGILGIRCWCFRKSG